MQSSDVQAASEGKGEAGDGRLSSVTAAIRLLKVFSEQEPEIGISNLAKRMGLAKSTVHRLATTLVAEGLLEQNEENGRYRLGIQLFTLGALVRRRFDVSKQAVPFLHVLREQTGETVHLAVLDDTNIVYLFNLESDQAIRMRSYIGVRKPAFCTAEGQVLLAFRTPDVVARVLKAGLVSRTPNTNTDTQVFLKALEKVRRENYSIDDEESEVGMRGIAAPVRDVSGSVVAAVGIGGPSQRLSKKTLRACVPHLLNAAEGISSTLGYRPPM
ncbi:IclR family transcriptional regulator [Paraburkholderia sp. LEh10]|uniref:IclR family transcriptional regulator n=1 Tax=Paraburkholderia sp. LEh10 TaxID=2821353 RepID=UPI001AEA06F5|nr:IclR family transcriptional regulator [Paraburkholderia sp. LEh10]MBP0592161.1 IclR family transcriptional regulator [Paraburkholderia sp. LEh10]